MAAPNASPHFTTIKSATTHVRIPRKQQASCFYTVNESSQESFYAGSGSGSRPCAQPRGDALFRSVSLPRSLPSPLQSPGSFFARTGTDHLISPVSAPCKKSCGETWWVTLDSDMDRSARNTVTFLPGQSSRSRASRHHHPATESHNEINDVTVIRGACVVNGDWIHRSDITVRGGKVDSLSESCVASQDRAELIEAEGGLVLPGRPVLVQSEELMSFAHGILAQRLTAKCITSLYIAVPIDGTGTRAQEIQELLQQEAPGIHFELLASIRASDPTDEDVILETTLKYGTGALQVTIDDDSNPTTLLTFAQFCKRNELILILRRSTSTKTESPVNYRTISDALWLVEEVRTPILIIVESESALKMAAAAAESSSTVSRNLMVEVPSHLVDAATWYRGMVVVEADLKSELNELQDSIDQSTTGIGQTRVVSLFVSNLHKIFNKYHSKGRIEVGREADLMILRRRESPEGSLMCCGSVQRGVWSSIRRIRSVKSATSNKYFTEAAGKDVTGLETVKQIQNEQDENGGTTEHHPKKKKLPPGGVSSLKLG